MAWKRTILRFTAGSVLLAAVLGWTGCTLDANPTGDQFEGIRVSGTGSVDVAPDVARTQIGVQTFAADAATAVAQNNQITDAVMTAIKGAGVADKDIKTVAFNIWPQADTRDGQYRVIGYQVNNSVNVTMRDLKRVGEVLQGAIGAGANNVGGISFTIDDPEPAREEAREKAIKQARDKAESMADAADTDVGKVLSITETSVSYPPDYRADGKAVAEGNVPVEPGELTVTVSVEMVFEID